MKFLLGPIKLDEQLELVHPHHRLVVNADFGFVSLLEHFGSGT